ncbi:MAG: penicillin acylase family protein [Melioribacteraceae bacterium]|nr:penicillin acylase family protein [Melioribacteraceae bacterium]
MKKSIWKTLIGISISILVFTAGATVIAFYMLKAPVPDYSGGQIVSSIKDDIDIYFDKNAVPYIYANSDEDAFYALGFTHARERLFQMDILRRAGTGKLSEIFGSKTVNIDKMFRTIGIESLAEKSLSKLDEKTAKIVENYCNGVNEYIQSNFNYSIEFDILNYEPELWKPVHTLLIVKLLAWELNLSWWSDIAYSHLTQKLGDELVKDIIPDYPENSPTIIPKNIRNFTAIGTDFIKLNKDFKSFTGLEGTHLGSNNWVVDSARSSSGSPIIANDPHLSLQVPGKWYVASLKSKSFNVQGFTLPGVPAIVIGKNKNISWAVTNVMTDDSDFYVEQFDSSKTKYFLNNAWKDLEVVKDTFAVKDSADAILTIRKTHRGPVISDIHLYNSLFGNEYQKKANISMRWTSFEFHKEMNAILNVNKAKNWNEFNNALSNFSAPGQNFIYADKEGNIGYICASKLPIRSSNNPTFVYDGSTTAHDWKGFVPYNKMPKLYKPASGRIATANNKVIKNFKYHITNIWEPTSRIDRITELLESKEKHSVADFMNYQMDFKSLHSKKLLKHLVKAFEKTEIKDENLNLALSIIKKWDYNLDKESQVPALYSVFFNKLIKNIFLDEMGEELFNEYSFLANIPMRMTLTLLERGYSFWFDDKNTDKIENKNIILRKSLIEAIEELESKLGTDIANWQWRKLHSVEFRHLFSGQSSLLDQLINIGPFEIGGDATSLFKTSYSLSNPYDVQIGPSMRYIYDFSDKDKFFYILPTGQSGHVFSKHYNDMSEDWVNGKYRTVHLDEEFIKNNLENKIVLKVSK